MKYMNFLSSCSYAGLANLLEGVGVDTEDVKIALDIYLPWLLECRQENQEHKTGTYSGGTYTAGAMLQGAQWFNRYLKPRGWQFVETVYRKEEVVDGLLPDSMLGLKVSGQSKHAVIFRGKREGKFVFLNNRRKESKEPEFFVLTGEECLERLEDTVWVGRLAECGREAVDFAPLLKASLENWGRWWEEFSEFAAHRQEWAALCLAKDMLFRAFLLDGLAVCGLILTGETKEEAKGMEPAGKWEAQVVLARQQQERLTCLQRQYLAVMQRKEAALLGEEMDMELARRAVEGYQEMIRERLVTSFGL